MPIRDRITWGDKNPLSDPRFDGLEQYVANIRQGKLPPNVVGGSEFKNLDKDLPEKPPQYYREYDVTPTAPGQNRGTYRLVLGNGGEVYITGNHYRDFRQIVGMRSDDPEARRTESLKKLEDLRQRIQTQLNHAVGDHKAQQAILTDTSSASKIAIGALGYWANHLFNSDIPDLLIWNNAEGRLRSAAAAIKGRDVAKATKELMMARLEYLRAMKRYSTWKDGVEVACGKMKIAIGVTAVLAVLAFVGGSLAAAAIGEGAAGAGAGAGATAEAQTMARIAQSVAEAEKVFLRVATAVEEEEAVARMVEAAEEVGRLSL
jgi:hypothetical protein